MSYQFYRWFPSNYVVDTMHLSWLEDLAYRRLIDHYNVTGKPLKNDRNHIMRVVRAVELEQQAAVDKVLEEFFVLKADGWHQKRCDREIRWRTGINAHAQRAANARWRKRKRAMGLHAGAMQGQCELEPELEVQQLPLLSVVPGGGTSKGQVHSTPRKRGSESKFELPDWIPVEQWKAWIETRTKRRNPPTPFALSLAVAKLEQLRDQGFHPAAVLAQSAFRGWAGLFPVKEAS